MDDSATYLLSGVIAVIRADSPTQALTLARGLDGTPVSSVEITMTVPDAVEVVRELSGTLSVPIGMGTVLDENAVEMSVAAGASFIVSPGLDRRVVEAALRANVPVVPGALTPSEIMEAWALGATAVKVFPVSAVGGPAYVKAVKAPLPHIPLVVSGGIGTDEVGAYAEAGALGISLGSSLVDASVLAKGEDEIRDHVRGRLGQPSG